MKKKLYIIPTLKVQKVEIQQMICGSIVGAIGGDSGITSGGEETAVPVGGADSRGSLWDEDEY